MSTVNVIFSYILIIDLKKFLILSTSEFTTIATDTARFQKL